MNADGAVKTARGATKSPTDKKRSRPAKRTMPDPIPDNIAHAIVTTPRKAKDEWRYQQDGEN